MKQRVLFVCVHNSARSQMAEEYLRKYGGDRFEPESAGIEPGTLNPLAVAVLKEDGIDISHKKTNDVFAFLEEGRLYRYVIAVCGKDAVGTAEGEQPCTLFGWWNHPCGRSVHQHQRHLNALGAASQYINFRTRARQELVLKPTLAFRPDDPPAGEIAGNQGRAT